MIWPHATPEHPCPICNKSDWCTFGQRAMLCRRVESEHPCSNGGWYHFYGSPNPEFIPRQSQAPPRQIDADMMMRHWRSSTNTETVVEISAELGVSPLSLAQLGSAWSDTHDALAFPMKDGDGDTIGIRLRKKNGFKWAVSGSRTGIFVTGQDVDQIEDKIAYLPEGPTDTAALMSLGLFTIGRPTCLAGAEQIMATMERFGVYRAVIVADNDEMKRLGNHEGRPGIEAALRLKKQLGVKSCIWIPPSPLKDAREFVRKGGTRQMIEADINNKVWSHS